MLHFFNDVFLLHLILQSTKSVFQRLGFLESNLCQLNCTPYSVFLNSSFIAI